MKEKLRKFIASRKEDELALLLVCFVLIVLTALLFVFMYSLSKNEKNFILERQSLKTEIAEKEKEVTSLKGTLQATLEENQSISGLLSTEQRKVYDLEREQRRNEREIEDLTKLTTLDPELLKKYSKVYFLSENYVPANIEKVDPKYIYDKARTFEVLGDIVPFLSDMIDDAEGEGVIIRIGSAYRSFATQKALKDRNVVVYGAGTANSFSAEQGYSEHQLGTTLDFTTTSLGGALTGFQNTEAYKWLLENAYKYGFVLSYPPNNKYYIYEPWHWRFVGKDLARHLNREEKYFYELDQREIDEYLLDIFE